MENLNILSLADIGADGISISSTIYDPTDYDKVIEQLDSILSTTPTFSTLAKQEQSFYTIFPDFKLSSPLYRFVSATSNTSAHYEIKIPFLWKEYEIPRFGVLAFTAKKTVYTIWEVTFTPWNSEGKDSKGKIDWMKLYYVDSFPQFRTLERILLQAFQSNSLNGSNTPQSKPLKLDSLE